jgi:hypothetical protein
MIIRIAKSAALTTIARTVPLDPQGRGERFRGRHSAHLAFRKVYASQEWPEWRMPAVRKWTATPLQVNIETDDYREGHQEFVALITRILDGDVSAIATILCEDLEEMPLGYLPTQGGNRVQLAR